MKSISGSGFRALDPEKTDKVFIYAATSPQSLAIAHGASSQSTVFVTAYEAFGPAGLEHSLESTGAKAIFVDQNLCPKVIWTLTSKALPCAGVVVYNYPPAGAAAADTKWTVDLLKLKETRPQLQVLSFTELREVGQSKIADPVPPGREDLCATGPPDTKGGSVAGLDSVIGDYPSPTDSFLVYLSLAHVLEFAFENSHLFWGVTVGYGGARMLFDYITPSGTPQKGDLRAFQPTFMVGVPAIWERIKKAILVKTNDAGLVESAASGHGRRPRRCGSHPDCRGQIDLTRSSSALLAKWLGLACEWNTGSVGSIPASLEMKLVDYPEAGYFSSNNPPRGEIWICGDSVVEGYCDNEEDTKSTIVPDGWLRTGEIGQWEPNGHLRIIDRKMILVKTLNGEYIALEKLESIYRLATLMANICIHISPQWAKPIAIVISSPPDLKQLATQHGPDSKAEISALTQQPDVVSDALQQLQQAAKEAGPNSIEVVEAVALVDDPEWSPQNASAPVSVSWVAFERCCPWS
ncbi:hypothetical protein DL769_011373 [Monosporascus sp. CRB-8-3]|nr:hypothetical protein DL769_011373 [Monosporascus sp. CRB-8-3]